MKLKLLFFFLSLAFAINNNLKAGNENYTDTVSSAGNTLCTGNTLLVTDYMYDYMQNNPGWKNEFVNHKVQNIITLEINRNNSAFEKESFKISINIIVNYNLEDGSVQSKSETLEVSYNPGRQCLETDKDILILDGAHKSEIIITEIKLNGNTTDECDKLPKNLYMESTINIERYYKLDINSTSSVSFLSGININSNFINSESQLKISWPYIKGAEEYELEWSFVDIGIYNNQIPANVKYNFRNNSTRVSTSANTYKIPVIYNKGYIIARIRATGKDISDISRKISSNWSVEEKGNFNIITAGKYTYYINGHEPNKNWQYSADYAEQGKRKEIINYFDGTLRNRQSITKSNTDNNSIIGQTIYDYTGRPAIQILPAPSMDMPNLKYRNNFITNTGNNLYSWQDFDIDNNCYSRTGKMSILTGSAKYYSANNPDKTGCNAYIPESYGYPFMQTEYTPDNTGRIRRQGDAGPVHQLTGTDESNNTINGHEIKYYYSVPFQEQLDRLFGNETGYSRHYKKNATVNQNGQISISYISPQNKVIATCLAGDPSVTDNLDPLPSSLSENTLKINLLDKNNINYNDLSIVSTSTYLVTTKGKHIFEYTIDAQTFTDKCLPQNICYDCIYDLTISITDECGKEMLTGGPVTKTVGNIESYKNSCSHSTVSFSTKEKPIEITMDIGTYTITKKLTVNKNSISTYTDKYIEQNTCIKTLNDFINLEKAKIDFSDCNYSCDKYTDEINRLFSVTSDIKTKSKISVIKKSKEEEQERAHQVEEYHETCENKNTCDVLYQTMLSDMSPGGQYANYTIGENNNIVCTDRFSIFSGTPAITSYSNPAIQYKNEDGSLSKIIINNSEKTPNQLSAIEFIKNWHDSWAKSLAVYHPEYCYYQFCINLDKSYDYDAEMLETQTAKEAAEKGFFNPINNCNSCSSSDIAPNLSNTDPFCTDGKGNITNQDLYYTLNFKMYNYPSNVSGNSNKTIWDFVSDEYYNQEGTVCFSDDEWLRFRAMYLSIKQQIVKQQAYTLTNCPNFPNKPETNECLAAVIPYINNLQYLKCAGKEQRYIFDTYSVLNVSTSNINDISQNAQNNIYDNCNNTCGSYADMWIDKFKDCGFTDNDKKLLREELVKICSMGCDENNPFGSSTSTIATANNNYTFEDAFNWIINKGNYNKSELCNIYLLDIPKPYNHSYFDNMPIDNCTCDKIQQNYNKYVSYKASNTLPKGVCSEKDLFEYTYGENIDIASLKCECRYRFNYTFENSGTTDCIKLMSQNEKSRTKCMLTEQAKQLELFLSYLAKNKFLISSGQVNLSSVPEFFNTVLYNKNKSCVPYCSALYTTSSARNTLENKLEITISDKCGLNCKIELYLPKAYDIQDISYFENIKPKSYISNTNEFFIQAYLASKGKFITVKGYTDCWPINECKEITKEKIFNVPASLACKHCLNCDLYRRTFIEFTNKNTYLNNASNDKKLELYTNFLNSTYNFNFSASDISALSESCKYTELKNYKPLNKSGVSGYELCYSPLLPENTTDECEKYLTDKATDNANLLYNQYIDSIKNDFEQRFVKHCLSAFETFTMEYKDREYHYTLFYYDQAGNLIKTIPPEGVNPLTATQTGYVSDYRKNPQQNNRVIPKHKFITSYKYNTINQVVEQSTPDGGKTWFWYDILGRVAISQNEKQKDENLYTYTLYDNLSRIIETGQIRNTTQLTPKIATTPQLLGNWLNVPFNQKTQVIQTYYDIPLISNISGFTQENLRERVAAITYEETNDNNPLIYNYAIQYSYDIHGNVKSMLNEIPALASVKNNYKITDYKYDLISGNVNEIQYQRGFSDQFFHRYEYDADNRLYNVYTSKDNIIWENDAKYFYYKHGPLARTETGAQKVQGIDYAYTIKGSLKGVNSNTMRPMRDIGKDGALLTGNQNRNFARDAFGYTIGYFDNDYNPIKTIDNVEMFEAFTKTSNISQTMKSLYDGNISYTATALPLTGSINTELIASVQGNTYRYDQLNRITQSKAFDNISIPNNKWLLTKNAFEIYNTSYKYDANGNITQLTRNGDNSTNPQMDNLKYYYEVDKNRLSYVEDAVTQFAYDYDIDNQNANNYTYDKTGNITSDVQEEIKNIEWNIYGKITRITRTDASKKPDLEFAYTPDGHRYLKIVKNKNSAGKPSGQEDWVYTYYLYDASGNIMATYTKKYEKPETKNTYNELLALSSHILYGNKRLGISNDSILLAKRTIKVNSYNPDGSFLSTITIFAENYNKPKDNTRTSLITGKKQYEMNNYLDNILVTISDRKIAVPDKKNTALIRYYEPDVLSVNDYYPFGMLMNGRTKSSGRYRFGFNGQEKDDEITGVSGSHTTALFWEYDTRLGRRWNMDPSPDANTSNYTCYKNNPIIYTDINGDIPWWELLEGWNKNNKPNPPTAKRLHPVDKTYKPHYGMDMAMKKGTPINSAASGTVIRVQNYSGYGKTIIVDHGNGILTLYAHLSETDVKTGDKITNGQTIGKVGNTGIGTGPHLHVEYIKMKSSKNKYSDSDLMLNKASNRFNPQAIDDLQNIISGKEQKEITFVDESKTTIGNTNNLFFNNDDLGISCQTYLSATKEQNLFDKACDAIKDFLGINNYYDDSYFETADKYEKWKENLKQK